MRFRLGCNQQTRPDEALELLRADPAARRGSLLLASLAADADTVQELLDRGASARAK